MVAISILNIKDDFDKIKKIDELNPDYIHVDVMDGEFVENKVDFLTLPNIKSKIDVHLMVYDIKKYIDIYMKYNPEYITFHYEATDNILDYINYIKKLGIKVGISIKPDTSVENIIKYLSIIDLVLVMSVEPGRGGQKFINNSTNKIDELYNLREKNNYHYLIEVDGGINNTTVQSCKNADILVIGSYITMSNDVNDSYESILKTLD